MDKKNRKPGSWSRQQLLKSQTQLNSSLYKHVKGTLNVLSVSYRRFIAAIYRASRSIDWYDCVFVCVCIHEVAPSCADSAVILQYSLHPGASLSAYILTSMWCVIYSSPGLPFIEIIYWSYNNWKKHICILNSSLLAVIIPHVYISH